MAKKEKTLDELLVQARRIADHREAGAEDEIRKVYKRLAKELQTFVADAYTKYGEDDKLTFAMLQKAAYNARFMEEVEERINLYMPEATKELRQLVSDTYKIAYEGMVDAVQKVGVDGLNAEFAEAISITPQQIRESVANPFMDVALEKNHKSIVYEIKQAVAVGLMNGDRYTTMSRKIQVLLDKENGPYRNAIRIARTEAHRVREAGNQAAAMEVDKALQNGTTGMRMVKTWKTMKDERVRPQRRRKGKKGWSTKMGKGPNHMILNGQTVLVDEPFDLKDGNKAMSPGQSGIAGHDINCRCYASRDLMDDAEFYALTGRHFPDNKEQKAVQKEKALLDEYDTVRADRDAVEIEMQQLDAQQFVNIWKNPVTAKDYELLKDRLPAKRDYFIQNGKQDMLALCDEFEDKGRRYMAKKSAFDAAGKRMGELESDIKAARLELMKARGIDVAKMKKEIDDLSAKINALAPVPKKVSMGTKVKNYDQKQLKEAFLSMSFDEAQIDAILSGSGDKTLKGLVEDNFYWKSQKNKFKQTLEKLAVVQPDPAEKARLQKLLADKTDELSKVMKRYGLEEDKFSQKRKDAAYWFTGSNARPEADKVLRADTGAVWRAATDAERYAAYKYTGGSGSFNRPLRGYDGGWGNYKGVGKVSLDNEGSGKAIQDLTNLINNSPSQVDIWLQRGVESSAGAAGFLGIPEKLLNASEDELKQLLVGKVVKDEAFNSTAAAKGSGFSGRLILNIYAPKGTKMIYAEPFSAYGRGSGKNWDGIATQSDFGSEFEVIMQRGTSYKITKVEKSAYTLYVDVDVVGQ